jgi:carbon storage regulator CsrA
MLALTRRVGEEVVIGDPKQPLGFIRVVDIHGDKVRLAFEFPREVAINRKELADQKRDGEPPKPKKPKPEEPRDDTPKHGHPPAA